MPAINTVAEALWRTGDRIGAPRVANEIVTPRPGASSILEGRQPASMADVKYASRNISPAEMESIRTRGYAEPPPSGSHYTKGGMDKWWSPADDRGPFGRAWKAAPDNVQIRAPIGEVPTNRAVPARVLEALDKTTGEWGPVKTIPGAAFRTGMGQVARRMAGPLGAVAMGADVGNMLWDAVVPRYAEGESIMKGPPRNNLQRAMDWIGGR